MPRIFFKPRKPYWLLFTVLGVTLWAPSVLAWGDSGRDFGAKEKRDLRYGKIVCRNHFKRSGGLKLVGGSCWQPIRLNVADAWKMLRDRKQYHRWIPGLEVTELVTHTQGTNRVRFVHRRGPFRGSYVATLSFDQSKHEVLFKVDPSYDGVIRTGWGYFRLTATKQGCLLSFGIMADLGSGFFSGLLRPTIHEWMLKTPAFFKRYAENRAKKH